MIWYVPKLITVHEWVGLDLYVSELVQGIWELVSAYGGQGLGVPRGSIHLLVD